MLPGLFFFLCLPTWFCFEKRKSERQHQHKHKHRRPRQMARFRDGEEGMRPNEQYNSSMCMHPPARKDVERVASLSIYGHVVWDCGLGLAVLWRLRVSRTLHSSAIPTVVPGHFLGSKRICNTTSGRGPLFLSLCRMRRRGRTACSGKDTCSYFLSFIDLLISSGFVVLQG